MAAMKHILFLGFLLPFFSVLSAQQAGSYRTTYDDSTLDMAGPMTLMPFNRLVRSAGNVVTYGDSSQENHCLDFAVLPDGQHMAVEDRYGIAVLDVHTQLLRHRWSFTEDRKTSDLMSTYSGIKTFAYNGQVYIVWGAAGKGRSAVMVAGWNESGISKVTEIPVKAVAPATLALPNAIAVQMEGGMPYLYVVLNGNNQLLKIRFADRQVLWAVPTGVAPFGVSVISNKVYVTNWAEIGRAHV